MHRFTIAVLGSALLLTAACSSSPESNQAGTSSGSPSPRSSLNLHAALLTPADLPGWYMAATQPTPGGENSDCPSLAGLTHDLGQPVLAELDQGTKPFPPSVTEYLSSGSIDTAKATFARAKQQATSCQAGLPGASSSMTAVPITTKGDDSFAVGADMGVVQSTQVAVRVGGTIMLIIYGVPSSNGTTDMGTLQGVVDKAAQKLQQ
ncbi:MULTISPECIES: hypothetical protein [Kitasatospora]|uniref:PknH-like extracellular domain-containing protein n=1 Tax=Kitasatospora setae (strain ATCC 33774 / DSM 43861 / JCM 3304 / KCC A-0304 / NBRC 14216 / KM-6054) TaxID=452652 RepID=E4NHN3_KITSK|nr:MULTISPECIES: hypothetical protein [Kitasatospora]BAJ31013.1 hypothetical protein KSE_52370 [Kitasatospora setae KM-6054]